MISRETLFTCRQVLVECIHPLNAAAFAASRKAHRRAYMWWVEDDPFVGRGRPEP